MKSIPLAVMCLSLFACAARQRPPGAPPETTVNVQGADGDGLVGKVMVLGVEKPDKDRCDADGAGCGVSVPAGVYLVKFHKLRGGRVGNLGGAGPSGKEKGAGCLLSRVRIQPGKPITCKANGGLDYCGGGKLHTMNCGDAVVQQWEPKAGEPTDIGDVFGD